jgi:hypothetical protein
MRRLPRPFGTLPFLLLVLASSVGACGGGGGGGAADVATAQILFPPPASLTTAEAITVRGAMTDPDDVVGITVNGVSATSADGYATWRAVVPLVEGGNPLTVRMLRADGSERLSPGDHTVERTTVLLGNAASIDRDPATGRIFVFDRHEGLIAFDAAGANPEVVSSLDRSFLDRQYASGGVFDAGTQAWYQLYREELVRIDVDTGARTTLAGTGPELDINVEDIDVDGAGAAYVVGGFKMLGSALVRVDLATGDRTLVSGAGAGSGAYYFGNMVSIDVIPGGDVAYVFTYSNGLFEVDLATGERNLLLRRQDAVGVWPSSYTTNGLYVDVASTCAYLPVDSRIVCLDWSAGTVTTVFDGAASPQGPFGRILSLCQGAGPTLLCVDRAVRDGLGWGGLWSMDVSDGSVTRYTDTRVGSGGAELASPTDLVVDAPAQRLVILDETDRLFDLRLADGSRSILADDTRGSGPLIDPGTYKVAMGAGATAYLGDRGRLLRVDLATGDRTLLSDFPALGTGPEFDAAAGFVWDGPSNRVIAGADDDNLLLHVDPLTGDRVPFTTDPIYDVYDMDRDDLRDRICLAAETDADGYAVMTADLATGLISTLVYLDDDRTDDLNSAETLAADAVTGRVFLRERSFVYEVDAVTGALRFVTDLRDVLGGATAAFGDGLAAAPGTGVLFAGAEGAVLAIDADTGERVIIAK